MTDDVDMDALPTRSPGALVPLLLAIARAHAARRRARDLAHQMRKDGFVQPSPIDQRKALELDALALASAPDHEAMLLSPVAPLGVCSVLAPTSQDRTLSANRGTEVVSDPTNVLAVLCADRLTSGSDTVRLCTVHQTLRAQPLPPGAGFTRHFRLFALADAGRAEPEHHFERRAALEQLRAFDRLVTACAARGWDLACSSVVLSAAEGEQALADRLAADIAAALPHLELRRQPLTNTAYYDGMRLQLGVTSPEHGEVLIADIGRFDWVATLTGNRKLRCVAGGFGLQLVALRFEGGPTGSVPGDD